MPQLFEVECMPIVQVSVWEGITPKTCPHCQAPNPYTNRHCDSCAMPLALEDYKTEIEKRRNPKSSQIGNRLQKEQTLAYLEIQNHEMQQKQIMVSFSQLSAHKTQETFTFS